MSLEKQLFGLVRFNKKNDSANAFQPSYHASHRYNNAGAQSPARSPKNIIGLLKTHGSRTRRASMPRATVRISVNTPSGAPAIRISL